MASPGRPESASLTDSKFLRPNFTLSFGTRGTCDRTLKNIVEPILQGLVLKTQTDISSEQSKGSEIWFKS